MKEQEEGRQCYWSLRHGREGSDRSFIHSTRATAARIRAGRGGEREKTPRPLFRLPVSLPPSGLSSAFRSLFRLPVSLPPAGLSSAFPSLFRLPVSLPPSGLSSAFLSLSWCRLLANPDVTLGLGVCSPQPSEAQGGRACGQWAQRGTGDQTAQTPVL